MNELVSVSLSWGVTFLLQTGGGVLGNSCLFCLCTCTFLTAWTWRPIDLILNQLVFANTLALLSKGIPYTMAAFGMKPYLGEAGCKVVICVYRVSRGVTLSTTCLLSGFQTLKLQPGVSGCVQPRLRSAKGVALCCALCWLLHILFNLGFGMWITVPKDSKNLSMYKFCSLPASGGIAFLIWAMIFVIIDGTCLGLMAWGSGSMLLVLHRHRQQVQYICSHRLGPRASCEMRAARSILVLVSLFLSFYSLSSVLSLCIIQVGTPSPWLVSMSYLASSGFSTLSPLVFIFNDARVSRLCPAYYTGEGCWLWCLGCLPWKSLQFPGLGLYMEQSKPNSGSRHL